MKIRESRGFTLIELLIVVAIIGIIRGYRGARFAARAHVGNEASAIGSLRAINSGEASYSSSCAAGGDAIDLADLVKAPSGTPSGVQGFISPNLKSNGVEKSGYTVTLAKDATTGTVDLSAVTTCNGSTATPASSYFAKADPVTAGGTGTRYFATDTRGTLFYSTSATVANPIPSDSSVVQ